MSSIRKSPYEEGLYFVDPEPGSTMQSIGSMEWKVGSGYELIRVLGYGSYSCVCLAKSRVDGGLVALKRIGNVLNSHEQTKRPSSTGECRLVGGKLVHCSVDLYIATEFADGGDLYHMKGQLTGDEVTAILLAVIGRTEISAFVASVASGCEEPECVLGVAGRAEGRKVGGLWECTESF
eukprot:jgi/Picre1/32477/NNA_007823.t1